VTIAVRLAVLSARYEGFQAIAPEARCWAVGTGPPAKLAHRIVGTWPGNDAVQTACGSTICLHGDAEHPGFRDGGRSFPSLGVVPPRYRVCLKCVAEDETVE
jgi:hypothetical protein